MSKKILTKKSKKDPSPLAKACIDNYFANGCDKVKAYCDAKKIEEPTDTSKRVQYNNIVSQMLLRYPDYKTAHHKKNEKSMKNIKNKLTSSLDKVNDAYFQLLEMAQKDSLTEIEESKFNRLRSIISTTDLNKAIDLYGKLTGAFEAEKHEVNHSFKVNFGVSPTPLNQDNKE